MAKGRILAAIGAVVLAWSLAGETLAGEVKPGDTFKHGAGAPEMVGVPAGGCRMG